MGAYVKFFVQEDCPQCGHAKEVLDKLIKTDVMVKLFDIGTVDGMTEAAFHEVLSTPTTIIVDDEENELRSWRGVAPTYEDVEENMNVLYK
jgi:glutaredoxin